MTTTRKITTGTYAVEIDGRTYVVSGTANRWSVRLGGERIASFLVTKADAVRAAEAHAHQTR